MKAPCLTYEEIMSKRLDDNELTILKHLCMEPEKGLESSNLQKLVGIDKATFYKKLYRLTDDLLIVERLPYTFTKVKDRRKVYYRVKPECLDLCSELVAGFEIRQFLAKTSFQTLVPNQTGALRKMDIGLERPIGISVFANKKFNPSFVSETFGKENFSKDLIKVIDRLFKSIMKGMENMNDVKIALIFHYPLYEV